VFSYKYAQFIIYTCCFDLFYESTLGYCLYLLVDLVFTEVYAETPEEVKESVIQKVSETTNQSSEQVRNSYN